MTTTTQAQPSTVVEALYAQNPGSVAVRMPGGDWSYGELRARIDAMAAGLAAAGIGHGARTMLRIEDSPRLMVVTLAVAKLGAIAVPVNPVLRGAELEHLLEDADPDAFVAEEPLLADLPGAGGGVVVVGGEAAGDGAARVLRQCPRPAQPTAPVAADAATILYTSGSSGKPKGVVLSHRAHFTIGRDFAAAVDTRAGDVYLLCAPLFHVSGWSTILYPTFVSGCSVAIPGRFSASRFWEDVERWSPTIWPTGLAFLEMLAAGGGEPPERTSFRHVVSNLRPDTWELAKGRLGLPIGTYLGLTETDGRGAITPLIDEFEPGLLGTPYADTDGTRITREGEVLAAGEVGEIEFRGPSTMDCYFRNPEATAAALSADGWLRTGDLGELDERGRLFYRGRIKNVIRRAGENVSAEEVELALLGHPEVVDAIVIGVPDRVREEEVKALVVARPGSAVDAAALHEFCAANLSAFKVPRYLELRAELPRTVSGKPDVGTVRRTMAGTDDAWDARAESGSLR